MADNYAESFGDLPKAGSAEQPQATSTVLPNSAESTARIKAFYAEKQNEFYAKAAGVDTTSVFYSTGAFVSNLSTKATEGIQAMTSKFADNVPFAKAAAQAPTFSQLLSPQYYVDQASGAAVSAVKGVVGKAFGGAKGLLPDSAINNLVALKGAGPTASLIKSAQGSAVEGSARDHIVKLTSKIDKEVVEFEVMPEIVENRSVDYEASAPAQFPGAFQKYKGTQSTQWTLNATLISRTRAEATRNLAYIQRLRSWTMPFFGENTRLAYPNRIGAPPPVLILSGLRKSIIGPNSVVMTSLSWNWPRDVDYIPANAADGSAQNIPFPTVMTVAIQLVESYSTKEFNQFSLKDFAQGKMMDSFTTAVAQTKMVVATEQPKREEAQHVSGTGPGVQTSGANSVGNAGRGGSNDPRRIDLAPASAAGGGRGSINPPLATSTVISEKPEVAPTAQPVAAPAKDLDRQTGLPVVADPKQKLQGKILSLGGDIDLANRRITGYSDANGLGSSDPEQVRFATLSIAARQKEIAASQAEIAALQKQLDAT